MAEDSSIVDGLRAGDVQAWSELYGRHVKSVWRNVERRVGTNSTEVADIVQEIFLDAARSVHTYRETAGTLSQWLSGITHRKISMHWRQKERHKRFAVSDVHQLFYWLDGAVEEPPSILQSQELVRAVRDTLSRITHKNAELLTQKYLSGKAVREMAEECNVSHSAMEAQLKRARKQFKDEFSRRHSKEFEASECSTRKES